MAAHDDIREFLTTRRAKITPEQAGLPVYGVNRRVVGLRREEVALLAGISVEYYTRLERGTEGKVRAIGVSNFMVDHLERLLAETTVVPAVNQVELHPYFIQQAVQDADAKHGILTQAWSPIGGITFYRDSGHPSALENPVITGLAAKHGKSPAQVMLRWGLQQGRSVIPKSTKPRRIAENYDVFDFNLSQDELDALDALDTGRRGGPEPDDVTLEVFGREIPEA